jgi:hypothetical protein
MTAMGHEGKARLPRLSDRFSIAAYVKLQFDYFLL